MRKFLDGRLYFRTSAGGNVYLVRMNYPFTVTFFLRMQNGTGGNLTVSLLERKPKLPYGLNGGSGPWHLVPIGSKILTDPARTPTYLSTIVLTNLKNDIEPFLTLNDGLPWPVDTPDYGV